MLHLIVVLATCSPSLLAAPAAAQPHAPGAQRRGRRGAPPTA